MKAPFSGSNLVIFNNLMAQNESEWPKPRDFRFQNLLASDSNTETTQCLTFNQKLYLNVCKTKMPPKSGSYNQISILPAIRAKIVTK